MLLAKDHLSHWRDEMTAAKVAHADGVSKAGGAGASRESAGRSHWFDSPEVQASVKKTVDLIAGVSSKVLMVDLLQVLDELEVSQSSTRRRIEGDREGCRYP